MKGTVVFTFEDGSEVIKPLGGMTRGIIKNGERPTGYHLVFHTQVIEEKDALSKMRKLTHWVEQDVIPALGKYRHIY